MDDDQLLWELRELLRTAPPRVDVTRSRSAHVGWLGRTAAALEAWDIVKGSLAKFHIDGIDSHLTGISHYDNLVIAMHQAISDLELKNEGPLSASFATGEVFGYFDELRKIIEPACQDVFFVDPYLNPEFVSRFLPQIRHGVPIRLLSRERISALVPAVESFGVETGQSIEVRKASGFHDRYVLIDNCSCYQSGASFKDGANRKHTTVTQITDAFQAVRQTYEDLWESATPVLTVKS